MFHCLKRESAGRLSRTAIAFAMAACLFAAATARAQDTPPTVDEIIAMATEKAGAIKSFSSDIEMKMSLMGMMEVTFKGKIIARDELSRMDMTGAIDMGDPSMIMEMSMVQVMDADGMMWMEIDMPMMGQQMVIKGSLEQLGDAAGSMMGANPMMGSSMKGSSPSMAGQINPENLNNLKEAYDLSYGGETDLDGEKVWIIDGVMKAETKDSIDAASGGQMSAMGISLDRSQLFISQATGFMRRMQQLDANGAPMMTMDFKNVKANPEIEEGTFTYTPPAGVPVMDMTEMMGMAGVAPPSALAPTPTPPPVDRG